MEFPARPCPELAPVRQQLSQEKIDDVLAHTRQALQSIHFRSKLKPGQRIAITAGSRGTGGLLPILQALAAEIREAGAEPFVIPAMGSHGGATPEGQKQILEGLGLGEDALGMPICPTMDSVELGTSETGAVAHLDRNAAEADGIVVLGRVKTHPSCAGELASGLLKMTVVGLGKQAGAQSAHNHGLWDSVRAVPKITLARSKVLCGVAVVENAFRQPVAVEAIPGDYDSFLQADIRLLREAKRHLPKIPYSQLDLLIVDRLGKNISGTGMDPNVIGHWRLKGGPPEPDYHRLVVLSLTPESLGNGLGIGMADFTTRRFADAFDWGVTWINVLTSVGPKSNPREGNLPLPLPSDREAIEVALYSALAGKHPRVCRIQDTADLTRFWISPGLLEETRANANLEVEGEFAPLAYDEHGNLF